jgi:23S rRNA pseudouridine1911/1915/1917 synthase
MSDRLTVKENITLLPFLSIRLQGWSRNTIKQRLKGGCVRVNGEQITRHDHELIAGDQVIVEASGCLSKKQGPACSGHPA